MRRRGEHSERSFAHVYDTGAMRRTHLRGHRNILKRLLVHAGGFNLGLLMRHRIGAGHAARPSGPCLGFLCDRVVAHRCGRPAVWHRWLRALS